MSGPVQGRGHVPGIVIVSVCYVIAQLKVAPITHSMFTL